MCERIESPVVCEVRDSNRNRQELLFNQGKIECAGKGVLGKGRGWGKGCFSLGFEGLWGQRVGGGAQGESLVLWGWSVTMCSHDGLAAAAVAGLGIYRLQNGK